MTFSRFANALAILVVTSVMSLHGLLVVAALMLILSAGGGLTLLWPGFAFTCLMIGLGGLALAMVIVFILIPVLNIDLDDLHND